MHSKQNAAVAAIVVLLGAVAWGLVRTAGDPAPKTPVVPQAADATPPVDGSSLATAQQLVRLPTTPEERAFAEDAMRLADKEMDLAFADAVRRIAVRPPRKTPAIDSIETHIRQAQGELAADQAQVAALTADTAKATGAAKATFTERLNLARAHQGLVQDELDDATQDLRREGGDPQGRMEAMMAEHDEMSKSSDSVHVNLVPATNEHGLVRHAATWLALNQKQRSLALARFAADSAATEFERRHEALEARRRARQALPDTSASRAAWAAMLLDTQRSALAQKTRGNLDEHVDDQHHLADTYARWRTVVQSQQRRAVNRALRGVAVILGILLIALLIQQWLERLLGRTAMEQRRTQTLYMVLRVTMQVIAALLILLVIFGMPSNMGTFLGLAGAGLTVALKDPILGFFGWFVLMGRDGIAIGDLVEINDVTGEVVEIGMLHTVLLETGSWADSGHLTGRRVTFSNSFAIEKHYFNYSTNGRWLWDDVRFVIPAGRDATGIVAELQRRVAALTAQSAERAEQEMKSVRRGPRAGVVSTAPAVHVKPIVGGVEVTVRYLTHVRERAELRAELYQVAITLLEQPVAALPATVVA